MAFGILIRDSMKKVLFYPLAFLWKEVHRIRRLMYYSGLLNQRSYKVPVISVGNLTFGGTGKTPLTIWLSDFFYKLGKRTLILTRGYKGNLEHKVGVISGDDTFRFNPYDYGDEAILLARNLKNGSVVVGKDRVKNLEYYFEEILPDVVLLDDGFQHLKINRSLNIVLFDGYLPLSEYKVAPFGFLREGLDALEDADVVVISRADQISESKKRSLGELVKEYMNSSAILLEMAFRPKGFYDGHHNKVMTVDEIRGKKVLCTVAIGSPNSFFSLIDSLGAEIVDRISFPDHHFYSQEDISIILEKAESQNAIIITSEKDIVKIRQISMDLSIMYLGIDVDFIKGAEEFKQRLENLI